MPSHGTNRGSNPLRDANYINDLAFSFRNGCPGSVPAVPRVPRYPGVSRSPSGVVTLGHVTRIWCVSFLQRVATHCY